MAFVKPRRSQALWLAVMLSSISTTQSQADISNQTLAVYFSPGGKCTEKIVETIAKARSTIHVQAYSFTSAPIAKALTDAHKRGIKIRVILDKSQRTANYSSADFLLHAGIETLIDDQHAIAHNKVIIIDSSTVITGSFNFTKAAENNNAENLLIIQNTSLAEQYKRNWEQHAGHSTDYSPRK